MTKHEIEYIVTALGVAIGELQKLGGKLPLPWHVEGVTLWLLAETRDGVTYKKPICKLVTR